MSLRARWMRRRRAVVFVVRNRDRGPEGRRKDRWFRTLRWAKRYAERSDGSVLSAGSEFWGDVS